MSAGDTTTNGYALCEVKRPGGSTIGKAMQRNLLLKGRMTNVFYIVASPITPDEGGAPPPDFNPHLATTGRAQKLLSRQYH